MLDRLVTGTAAQHRAGAPTKQCTATVIAALRQWGAPSRPQRQAKVPTRAPRAFSVVTRLPARWVNAVVRRCNNNELGRQVYRFDPLYRYCPALLPCACSSSAIDERVLQLRLNRNTYTCTYVRFVANSYTWIRIAMRHVSRTILQ